MNFIIRTFTNRDTKEVIDLWNNVFANPTGHNDPQLVIDMKTALKDDLFFVCEANTKITGTVIAGYDGHRGWIYSLAVLPEHRKSGMGKALVEQALSALQKKGCKKVNLQVRSDNEQVIEFYHKLGFKQEERISMGILLD